MDEKPTKRLCHYCILVTGASGNLGEKIILKLHILKKFRIVG